MKEKLFHYLFVLPRVFKYHVLSENIVIGKLFKKNIPCLFNGKGQIKIGNNTELGVKSSPYFYSNYSYFEARSTEAKITIGERVYINNKCSIVADKTEIQIKNDVLIGTNCMIVDSDFHNLHPKKRHNNNQTCKKVVVEKNVFIGNNVTILKGVTIGENSVIGSGSIVVQNIPENVIASGVPCKVIKPIDA